jgi:branched-chain amino acid transport system permease protein
MNSLSFIFQVLFAGLAVGAIYALVSLGFVLIIRATNVVNFAQGDFAMLGAYAMVSLFSFAHLPYLVSIVLSLVVMAIFGVIFNYGVYYPLC